MTLSATIKDVALMAGVSAKTVSRVVNGEPHVSDHTRRLVEHAIGALGYQPNLVARALVASRSFLIGLLSMRLDADVFRSLHSAGIRACRERGFHLVADEIEDITPDSLRALEMRLRQMRCDGVILSQLSDHAGVLEILERLGVPYVRLSPTLPSKRSPAVSSDIAAGLGLLAEHLWTLGHRRIAVPRVDPWRYHTMCEALCRVGVRPRDIVTVPLDWRQTPMTSGIALAQAVLSLRRRPTAVYAFNDEVAAAFIHHAWSNGVRVPEDISVAGFDDAVVSRVMWPPITTVRQPFADMMTQAVALLTQSPGEAIEIVCPVQLIARASTAPPSHGLNSSV